MHDILYPPPFAFHVIKKASGLCNLLDPEAVRNAALTIADANKACAGSQELILLSNMYWLS